MPVFKVKPFEGEGGGGGVTLVDTLPELGDESLIYKTPDGKLYSCVNTEETRVICDLEVGKSYKLVESISYEDLQRAYDILGNNFQFIEDADYPAFVAEIDAGTGDNSYTYELSANDGAYYVLPVESTSDPIVLQFKGSVTESPDVEFTEYAYTMIVSSAGEDYLLDVSKLFQGGYHTETVVTSTWTEIGAGGSKLQYISIYCSVDGYPASLTLNVDDSTLETYEDLVNYLGEKNCVAVNENAFKYNLYPCNGAVEYEGVISGIYTGSSSAEPPYELNTLYCNIGHNFYDIPNDESFSITYLGNN